MAEKDHDRNNEAPPTDESVQAESQLEDAAYQPYPTAPEDGDPGPTTGGG